MTDEPSASTSGPLEAPASPSTGQEFRLSCSDVTVHYGGVAAIEDVGLGVPPSTIVGLVGPNGAGKSTLFGVLSGLVRPVRGTVLLDGADVTRARPQVRAARGLGRTFQHPELFVGLTVREHLVLAYRAKHSRRRTWSDLFAMGSLRRTPPAERQTVDELLELLGLGPIAGQPALGLPLGSARLLELGRTLAASPTVLLLDEPSSGLDSSETEQFEHSLRLVNRERRTSVLLVEHDVDLVMRLCSSIHVLDFGVLIASGSPDEIHANPTVRAAYLGEHLSGEEGTPSRPESAQGEGHQVASTVSVSSDPVPSTTPRGPALKIEDLSVRYGEATALTDISFEVGAGKAVAVLGANGAGKSSLARALSGLVRPTRGRILLGDKDITGSPAHRVRRAGLVYLPETRGIFRTLTVTDNLRMAARTLGDRQTRQDAVDRSFEMFPTLAARRRIPARNLSGGEQQMLSLARALAEFPDVLVADELSLGLAPTIVDRVFEGLARAKEAGVTLVMIEQYVHRALEFADDCLVLQRGELVWNGPSAEAHGEVLRHYFGDAMAAAG
jgi:ABC-type branched-subunit amino acid transport system ATPase component